VVTPFEGIAAACYSLNSLAKGTDLWRTDVYSSGIQWRGSVSNAISTKNPIGAFFYDTGMSMVDTSALIASSALTGGAGAPLLSAATMGSRSYVSSLNDALDRGISLDTSIYYALGSAIIESICENYSVGHLMNLENKIGEGTISFIKKVAPRNSIQEKALYIAAGAITQGIAEGEEELCTEVLNSFYDQILCKESSNFNLAVQSYLNLGMSEDEAIRNAFIDESKNCALAFAGGFASGVAFGGFKAGKITRQAAVNQVNVIDLDTHIKRVEEVIRESESVENESKYGEVVDEKLLDSISENQQENISNSFISKEKIKIIIENLEYLTDLLNRVLEDLPQDQQDYIGNCFSTSNIIDFYNFLNESTKYMKENDLNINDFKLLLALMNGFSGSEEYLSPEESDYIIREILELCGNSFDQYISVDKIDANILNDFFEINLKYKEEINNSFLDDYFFKFEYVDFWDRNGLSDDLRSIIKNHSEEEIMNFINYYNKAIEKPKLTDYNLSLFSNEQFLLYIEKGFSLELSNFLLNSQNYPILVENIDAIAENLSFEFIERNNDLLNSHFNEKLFSDFILNDSISQSQKEMVVEICKDKLSKVLSIIDLDFALKYSEYIPTFLKFSDKPYFDLMIEAFPQIDDRDTFFENISRLEQNFLSDSTIPIINTYLKNPGCLIELENLGNATMFRDIFETLVQQHNNNLLYKKILETNF